MLYILFFLLFWICVSNQSIQYGSTISHTLFLLNQDQLYQDFWFIMQWLKLEEIFTYLEDMFLMEGTIRTRFTNWPAPLEIVSWQNWSSKWKLPEDIWLSSLLMILFVHQIETPKMLYYSPRILIFQLHFKIITDMSHWNTWTYSTDLSEVITNLFYKGFEHLKN